MTTDDERLLKLMRLDRWLQRRNPCRLWVEAAALVIGFACLEELLAVLWLEWFPPDSAGPIVYDCALCLDTMRPIAVASRLPGIAASSRADSPFVASLANLFHDRWRIRLAPLLPVPFLRC